VQQVVTLLPDCDGDAVLARVRSPDRRATRDRAPASVRRRSAADALGALDTTIAGQSH
jgi:hypothetical protein